MFLAAIPFDYAKLLEPGDRVRRTRKHPTGVRVRRTTATPPDKD
jgi:hypothetical protein